MAGTQSTNTFETGLRLDLGPVLHYHRDMVTLGTLQQRKIDLVLLQTADELVKYGLSTTVPLDGEGRISLPHAICKACGCKRPSKLAGVDNFNECMAIVPDSARAHVLMCWEAIELEVGEDIVDWSESVGLEETVGRIRRLAKEIQLPKIRTIS